MMLPPPLFIIGSPRSGTTLLRLMITSHPNIVVPPECGFAVWWRAKYADWRVEDSRGARLGDFIADLRSSRKIETWGLDFDRLRHAITAEEPRDYPALAALVYEDYARIYDPQARRWGDKNNFHLEHIAALRDLYPDALLLHIVRDGRDVACSYRELREGNSASAYAPKLPFEMGEIATEWSQNLATIRTSFDALDWKGVCEVRYEDLVVAPERELRRICEFLGEAWSPIMLDYAERNRRDGLEPAEFLAWKRRTLEPPDAARAGRFRRELSPGQIDEFEAVAREPLVRYKYL